MHLLCVFNINISNRGHFVSEIILFFARLVTKSERINPVFLGHVHSYPEMCMSKGIIIERIMTVVVKLAMVRKLV